MTKKQKKSNGMNNSRGGTAPQRTITRAGVAWKRCDGSAHGGKPCPPTDHQWFTWGRGGGNVVREGGRFAASYSMVGPLGTFATLNEAKAAVIEAHDKRVQRDHDYQCHKEAAKAANLRLYKAGWGRFGVQRLRDICSTGGAFTYIPAGHDGQTARADHPAVTFRVGDHKGFGDWLARTGPFYTQEQLDEFQSDLDAFKRKHQHPAASARRRKPTNKKVLQPKRTGTK